MTVPSVPPSAALAITLALALGLGASIIIVISIGGDGNRVSIAILAYWARVKELLNALVDELVN